MKMVYHLGTRSARMIPTHLSSSFRDVFELESNHLENDSSKCIFAYWIKRKIEPAILIIWRKYAEEYRGYQATVIGIVH